MSALDLDCALAGGGRAGAVAPHSAHFTVGAGDHSALMLVNGAVLHGAVQAESPHFITLAFGPMSMRDGAGDHAVNMQVIYTKATQHASVFTQLDGAEKALKAAGYCTLQAPNI